MDDIVIKVEQVSKVFKLPHEKHNSIKSLFLTAFKKGKRGYEKQRALSSVSFDIKRGEFYGIVGSNGSGKSTLLKIIAGIYSPTTGNVEVRGSLTPFIELGVGFNPQLTGRENVFLNGALLGFSRKQMAAMYDEIVEFAELKKFMDQKLKNYSSGMQVRLAFSIAIRARSDILLLDEVLAVGDAAFQQKCFDYFQELKERGQTVVFVSHDMGALRRFCDKAVYIEGGKVQYIGTPSDIADKYLKHNMEQAAMTADGSSKKSAWGLKTRVKNSTDKGLDFELTYKSKNREAMYIGISVIKDGISIAELTTPMSIKLRGNGKINYALDTSMFNAGAYELTAVLCQQKNRKLLAIADTKETFYIKGSDPTRGAALKLEDNWQQPITKK